MIRALALFAAALAGMASPVLAEEAAAPLPVAEATAATATDQPRVMVMLDLGAEHLRAGASYGGAYGDQMAEQARLRTARRIARENGLTVLESWPMPMIGVDCVIMAIGDGRTPEAVAATLSRIKGVSWSQPLNEFRMQSAPLASGAPAGASYNDRLYPAQLATSRWRLADLHRVATGRGVTIAIVDSRIDTAHPDLAGRIAPSDFVAGRPQPERHGTGVAGIIAARPNNAMGIAGIAPAARVLGLRACWERPLGGVTVCDSLSLAKALTFALENHADVINLSLSGPDDRLIAALIRQGLSRGVTVVAAVDEARAGTSFPASVNGVIPVGDERLQGSRPGVYIAPGRDVPTTEPEGKWGLVSGSSYAAAHVSGLAALLRQASGRGGREPVAALLGPGGEINACAAMARVGGGCQAR